MANKGNIIKSSEMKAGEYRRFLDDLKGDGEFIKLKNGLYADIDAIAADMVDIESIVPGGILCLYSAWAFYGMTTRIPDSFYVAIDRDRKVRLPKAIDVTLVYQSPSILEIGKTREIIAGHDIAIYDRERCVCDAIKYRNKIGIDVMQDIVTSYLNWPGRNLDRLSKYSQSLRVAQTLKRYLEISL